MGHNKPFGSSSHETEESLGSLPGKVVEGVGHEASEAVHSLWDQLLGGGHDKAPKHPPSYTEATKHDAPPSYAEAKSDMPPSYDGNSETGTLMEGVLFQLGLHNKNSEKSQQSLENHTETRRAGNEYHREIIEGGKGADRREQRELRQKIEQIMNELKQLIASTRELKHHFADVAVATTPATPGKYHENFFEWLLIMVKQARQKVENSSSWLGAVKGKGKGKGKGDYWDRAEKEGTTFTQNNERSAATSVG